MRACGTERRQSAAPSRNLGALQYRQRTLMLMVMNFFRMIGFFGWQLAGVSPVRRQQTAIACCTPSSSPLAYPLGCLFCTRLCRHRFGSKWQIVLRVLMTVSPHPLCKQSDPAGILRFK